MKHSDFDLNYQNKNIESRIVASLERISQAFRVLLWEESKEFALSPIQVQVLVFLLHHPAERRKVSYLAGEFNMTKATISDTVKALDEKKLISKKAAPDDTRSYTIELTAKGKKLAEKASLFTGVLRAPIEKLSKADKENLLVNLLEVIQHLHHTGIISIQRMCTTCTHFSKGQQGEPHFCKLLNQPLTRANLRVDCPEHELAR
jgi:DNA-binding MarR family transcriptional regulator